MKKLKKYHFLKMLEVFKKKGCITIDDMINLLNKDLKNDDDIVFSWR